MTTANLNKNESQALVNKFRRNTFGKFSDRLVAGLIEKGLVSPDNRRLTEDGIAMAERILRRND